MNHIWFHGISNVSLTSEALLSDQKDELGITDIPGDGTLPICSAVVDHSFTYLIRPLLALTHSLARVPPHSFSLVRSAANVLG